MTVYKINALTVPADSGDELAARFAKRAGAVDGQPGFLGFDLLKPTDGRTTWLVVTRWEDEASFEAWRDGRGSAEAHGHGAGRPGHDGGAPHGHGDSAGHDAGGRAHGEAGARGAHGHAHGEAPASRPAPLATNAELWSFERAGGSPAA